MIYIANVTKIKMNHKKIPIWTETISPPVSSTLGIGSLPIRLSGLFWDVRASQKETTALQPSSPVSTAAMIAGRDKSRPICPTRTSYSDAHAGQACSVCWVEFKLAAHRWHCAVSSHSILFRSTLKQLCPASICVSR